MKRWKVFVIACSAEASTSNRVDLVRKIVAGRAVHRPILPQRFVAGQDFLDHEVNGASVLGQRGSRAPLRNAAASFSKYSLGK